MTSTAVTIIGAGAVGSWTALALAKAGYALTVFDDDLVEPSNLGVQLYGPDDVGRPKVGALRDHVYRLTGRSIRAIPARWDSRPLRGLVVVAVDTMAARRAIYADVHDQPGVPGLLDIRVGQAFGQQPVGALYTIAPNQLGDQMVYESSLYDDDTTDQAGCMTATSPEMAMLAAALVTAQVGRIDQADAWERQITFGAHPPRAVGALGPGTRATA
jgi:hypothetical protein